MTLSSRRGKLKHSLHNRRGRRRNFAHFSMAQSKAAEVDVITIKAYSKSGNLLSGLS